MRLSLTKVFLLFALAISVTAFSAGCGGGGSSGGNQTDSDGDGLFDTSDLDDDNDGFADAEDCNPFSPDVCPETLAVWVSTAEGAPGNAGTITSPLSTIAGAIAFIAADPAAPKDIYTVKGTYPEDVTLENGVSIYGGFSLLDGETRSRNIGANKTVIDGDGSGTTPIVVDGTTVNLEYTLFINNSQSTVQGFTINGDDAGLNTLVLNSDATIENSTINDNPPAVPRDFSIPLGVLSNDANYAERTVNIKNNNINMKGTAGGTDAINFGIVAFPADGANDGTALNVEGNTISSSGATDNATGIYVADNDDDPNDDPATDGKADFGLAATGNKIAFNGAYDGGVLGIIGGSLFFDTLLPKPDVVFIRDFEAYNNIIEANVDGVTMVGINNELTRAKSEIGNNVVSINAYESEVIGIISAVASTNIQHNSIYIGGDKIATYSMVYALDNTGPAVNFGHVRLGNVANNIVNVNATNCPGGIGFAEMLPNDDPLLADRVSPLTFTNNDIYFDTACATTAFYLDDQGVPKVPILAIDDLNNKAGFLPGDSTVVSENVSVDPLFVDVSSNNLALEGSSPCIDAGIDLGDNWTDILGVSRPQGEGFDIGAYER